MGAKELKNELIRVIMGLSPKRQIELWDKLIESGYIVEQRHG